ncbi:unnamed protein product [Urochloa humidicola]
MTDATFHPFHRRNSQHVSEQGHTISSEGDGNCRFWINLDRIERSITGFDVSLRLSSSTNLCSVLLFYCSLGLGMRRTSLSPQAKLGSSQGGFTPLSRLTVGSHGWIRVRVRVSRIWVASNPNTGTVYSLDCLLIDDEGVTMQARAFPGDTMKRLKHQLVEGKVYALSDFTVVSKRQDYMACRNSLMIYMGDQTVVDEIDDGTSFSIPLHSFEFIDFDDVPSRDGERRFFTDVIGQIVSVEDIGEAWKWKNWRNVSFRNIHIRDLRGRELNVALFGDLGRNFDAEQVFKQGQKVPIVAVLAGMLVQLYPGKGFTVRSASASKYYLDLDIPEVQEFRASLTDPHRRIDRLPCQVQNPVNPADLVKRWRTIKQLKILNPHELQQGSTFLCRATLKGIDCNSNWFYRSCVHCKRSVSGDGITSLCIQGCPNNAPPVPRYKLNAVMEDATGTMDVMIFGDPAQELVGAGARELIGGVTGEKISAVLCSHQSHSFVISAANGCFVVKHILDYDELELIGSDQVGAGGDSLLSEEEVSSVSNNSSPVKIVKKETMVVIKKESEAGGGCELPQDGGSPASCSSSSRVKREKLAIKEDREPKRLKISKGNEAEHRDAVTFLQPSTIYHLRGIRRVHD